MKIHFYDGDEVDLIDRRGQLWNIPFQTRGKEPGSSKNDKPIDGEMGENPDAKGGAGRKKKHT